MYVLDSHSLINIDKIWQSRYVSFLDFLDAIVTDEFIIAFSVIKLECSRRLT